MKVQIVRIADRGIANKERLHLKVLVDTDLSFFVVFSTIYNNPSAISNTPQNVYWFPSTAVKAGDQVVLYSGFGQNKAEPASNGSMNHFFYWGQKNTQWNKYGECAVLFEVNSWQTSPIE
jgi:hypothetical protein